jgi:excisionase family DNA binding protein
VNESFLRVDEAAELAGVSPAAIRKWVSRGTLSAVKISGRLWFRELDVLEAERRTRDRAGRH